MTVREILKLLTEDGWYLKNQKRLSQIFLTPDKKGKVTVPDHGGDLDKKTARTILRQAELK